jgi:lipopolysaccharide transport system ATP-binding protein
MSQPIIEVEDLSKRYQLGVIGATSLRDSLQHQWQRLRGRAPEAKAGEFWALRDVSFTVQPGEVLGVIGRNGAGKSTLLKILSRITEPTSGRAILRGRVSSLLEVGTGFHPELSGRDNVFLNGAILGMTQAEIRRKFDEIVAFAEVEKFLDTPVKRYSSGMYVRLAFAVAAHLDPEILIVDEVLAVGDAAFQKKCLGKMGTVAKEGRTILFVSHAMSAVRTLCHTAVLLEQGRLLFAGKANDVIDRYLQISKADGSTGKITSRMRAVNTGEFSIDEILLRDQSGEATTELKVGEPFTIVLRFTVHSTVQNVRIGLGFNTPENLRISGLHHTDDDQLPFSGIPGTYEIAFTMVNPLLTGNYVISVGAHRALGGETVDYVPEALHFQVLPISVEAEVPVYASGLLRLYGKWSSVRAIKPPDRSQIASS